MCRTRRLGTLLATALIVTACGSGDPSTAPPPPPTAADEAAGGWIDGEPPTGGGGGGGDAMEEDAAALAAERAASGEADAGGDTGADGGSGVGEPESSGPLQGGSVDDNVDFADYLAYRRQFLTTGIEVHDRDVSERHVVAVTDPDGQPVLGADVALRSGDQVLATARTTADGTVRLFPLAAGADAAQTLQAVVTLGAASRTIDLPRESARHEVTIEAGPLAEPIALDVHFLLDATGSMGDELDRLKTTIADVAAQIGGLSTPTDLHLGLTAYRDTGDAYLTRTFDFTGDVAAFSGALDKVVADGGGDEPEALSEALQAALDEPAWREGRVLKLMFLVADAPPQLDRGADYAVEMVRAAAQGVMIVPLASSGTSDQGEYVFRQLALTTGGPFLFLTYGADGAPGEDTDHHVSGYDVLSLDQLVVKVIEDQLAHLAGEPVTPPQQ